MNEQAQKTLAEILQRILDGVDATVAFGKDQIPEILQQLLTWHFFESLVFFVMSLGWVAIGIGYVVYVFTRKPIPLDPTDKYTRYKRNFWFDSDGDTQGTQATALLGGGAAIIGLASAFGNLDWLKIWLTPKLYLLEYGATLIK
jgi:hypothetical protein